MALDVWSHWMNVPIQVSLIVSIESFKRISILNCVHYTRLKITNLKGMISEGSPGLRGLGFESRNRILGLWLFFHIHLL